MGKNEQRLCVKMPYGACIFQVNNNYSLPHS